MILLDIFTFFGRFHPLIVHLPIGFILLAIIFASLSHYKRYVFLSRAVPFTLLIGFVSAVTASMLGYMLSLTGDYDGLTLKNHMLGAISLTLLTGILLGIETSVFKKLISIPRRMFSVLSIAAFLLVVYTGHQGANLTHGKDYISMETLFRRPREKPLKAEDAMIFEDVVHPILEDRCMQCHQRSKRKGQLSMESLASILKGGKHGPAVVPGSLAESELFRRITLDAGHEDFMPAEGKTPLTKSQTEIIRWWIEKAMAVEQKKISEITGHQHAVPLVAFLLGLDSHSIGDVQGFAEHEINANIPSGIDMDLVENLRMKGMTVRVMFHKPVMLDVTLPSRSGIKIQDLTNELKPLAMNIVWLNLSDNGLTERDLAILKDMANLQKLRLEKNPISDGISDYLAGLKYLEAVNLNETKITNSCLDSLQQNHAIKRIYVWRTEAARSLLQRQENQSL